jgi:hypothetical protein
MIGYGIILSFEEALKNYARKDVKEFVIETINEEREMNDQALLDKKELAEADKDITKFWFDHGWGLYYIPRDDLMIERVATNKDKKMKEFLANTNPYIFVGFIIKIGIDTIELEEAKEKIDVEQTDEFLTDYGFDASKAKYYFTGGKWFTINVK